MGVLVPEITLPGLPDAISAWTGGFIIGDATYGRIGAAYTDNTLTDGSNWSDEEYTAGIQSVTVSRGRSPGVQTPVNAGSATIVVDISDGSTAFGDEDDWRMGGRVTIEVNRVDSSTRQTVFVGYLQQVTTVRDTLTDTTRMVFQATDFLAELAKFVYADTTVENPSTTLRATYISARINEAMFAIGWTYPEVIATDIDSDTQTLEATTSASITSIVQAAAAAGPGLFFISRDGNPTYRSYATLIAASYYTGASVVGDADHPVREWSRSQTIENIRNDIRVTNDAGQEGRDTDESVGTGVARRVYQANVGLDTQGQLDTCADRTLERGIRQTPTYLPLEIPTSRGDWTSDGTGDIEVAELDLDTPLWLDDGPRLVRALPLAIAHSWTATTQVWATKLTADTATPPL